MRLRDRLWLLMSQTVNALVFAGDPDESLSARAWREQWSKAIGRIDGVLGQGHCKAVWALQVARDAKRNQVKENQ